MLMTPEDEQDLDFYKLSGNNKEVQRIHFKYLIQRFKISSTVFRSEANAARTTEATKELQRQLNKLLK